MTLQLVLQYSSFYHYFRLLAAAVAARINLFCFYKMTKIDFAMLGKKARAEEEAECEGKTMKNRLVETFETSFRDLAEPIQSDL